MAARALPLSTPSTSAGDSQYNCRRANTLSLSLTPCLRLNSLQSPWLGPNKLLLQSSSSYLRTPLPKHGTVVLFSLSLPTAKPERGLSPEELPKWSSKAIKSFAMGEAEARMLWLPKTGTEGLLMGILVEATSLAARFLMADGITLFKVRGEVEKSRGKDYRKVTSPIYPPLTEAAERALDWAVDEKIKSGDGGEITTTHLLLGIWHEKESLGHKVLANLGFNEEKAKVLESWISEPGLAEV